MTNPQETSIIRRWLLSIFFWFALAWIIYLFLRWVVQPNWSLLMLGHNAAFYLFLPVLPGALMAMMLRAPRIAGVYWILLMIGLVWFVPRLMPPLTPPQPGSKPLKIVTFNLFPENQ